MNRNSALTLVAAVVCLSLCAPLLCAPLPPAPAEKTYYLTVPLVREGQACCAIVPPPGEEYAAVARELQDLLRRTGAAVPVLAAKDVKPQEDRGRTLILLGNFANNPAVLPLYHQHYVMSDDVWPGAGGYELRTVHDPFGTGVSFLYLGGSDPAGLSAAVKALGELLPPGPSAQLPPTIKVLSEGRSPAAGDVSAVPAQVKQLSGLQFREVAGRLSAAGLAYHSTGDLAQAEYFRLGLPVLAGIVAKMPQVTDARGSVLLPLICDLVEEAPVFTPADRNGMFRFLWEYANKCPNANGTHQPGVKPEGNNWDARANWAAASYFHKYYGLDVAGLWTWCDTYFGKGGQARFWKTAEDCPGYGSITYHDLLFYGLNRGDLTWFENGNLRRAADYGLMIINNLGAASGFGDTSEMSSANHWPGLLLDAAWYYRDGRYRYLYDLLPNKGFSAAEYVYSAYLDNSVKPVEPKDMLGIKVAPLDRWIYEHPQEALSSGTPVDKVLDEQPVPPYEKCFDKISFRTGYSADQQYLLLGGISHGYHSHPSGNAVIGFTDNRKYLLFDNGYFVPDTVEHNTLAVYRDGLFKPVPRFTTLEQRVDLGSLGLCQTQVADYNGTDWRRNLIWAKERWFVCIDEVQAREEAEFGLNCIWRTIGDLDLRADRFCSRQGETRFSLVNADGASFRVTGTTPPAADRHAVVQSSSPRLKAGAKAWFINLLYSPDGQADFPAEAVAAGAGGVLVREAEGITYCTVGGEPADDSLPRVTAALGAVRADGFTLAAATLLQWQKPRAECWLKADRPVDIAADLATGKARVVASAATKLTLAAGKGKCLLDGKAVTVETVGGTAAFKVPAGTHELVFPPLKITSSAALAAACERLQKQQQARLQAQQRSAAKAEGLKLLWEQDKGLTVSRSLYYPVGGRPEPAQAVPDLARLGTPSAWTPGSSGCHPAAACDGDPDTYSAVSSGAANVTALPKDLGVEWTEPRQVAQVRIHHYDLSYVPAPDGHDLQYWDGAAWVSLDDTVTGTDTPLWVHTFSPVKTTRVRLLVTKFGGMRTAVRSFEVFSVAVEQGETKVRQPQQVAALRILPLGASAGTGVVAAVGKLLCASDGSGKALWEAALPQEAADADVADVNGDGAAETVVAAGANLYCYDAGGKRLWEAACPKDKYFPEIEPAQGPFRVLRCDDLNGDGRGEIIAGSGNWFTYAFDSEGKLLWGTLNWAHQPTSIATVAIEGGKRAALVGNSYCAANLFSAEGKQIGEVPVGYHGAAMTAAAGDMDGDGKPELIAGSRIGGVHCRTRGADTAWDLQCGAEITATTLAEVNGDARQELLIASRNGYVICVDAAGKALWRRNCGSPVRALAVAGSGPALVIAAGTDGGAVVVLDGGGKVRGTCTTTADVTKLVLGDLDGNQRPEIVAATAEGKILALRIE